MTINIRNATRELIVQTLDDQGKYITCEELKILLNYWPEFHSIRLCCEIAAFIGLRGFDVVNLKVPHHSSFEGFSDDFKTFRYIVSKPKVAREDGFTRKRYKVKSRVVPEWLAIKLKLYFDNNRYTFKHNRMFPFSVKHLREEFRQARLSLSQQHQCFKDVWQVVIYPNGRVQNYYRISFHTLRSFWITRAAEANNYNIAMTARMIGHSKYETTYKYIRFHNLKEVERDMANSAFDRRNQPKLFTDKKQKKLGDYGIAKERIIDKQRFMFVGRQLFNICSNCGETFKSKSKKRKFCDSCKDKGQDRTT